MPTLKYTAGGETHTVEVGDSLSIGRMPPCDIVIEDEAAASRRHCQIMRLQSSYELSDLGSTNGTKVNGKPVKRHRLQHGDRISIGDTEFKWTDGDDDGLELELEEDVSLEEPAAASSGGKSDAPCYLVFAGGSRDGERVTLDVDRVTFGRKASNTIQLSDSAVSGYHCEIAREGGAYILRDLGSTNGTLLDGEPVGENVLQHGGRIKIGAERLVFVNPAVSEFESAMASVDDLGSEWGMLRAEMDMERINRARRSQMIATVGVLAVVGLGGWLVLGTDLLKPEGTKIATLDGNLVSDFSFETGTLRAQRVAGSPATAAIEVDEGGAHQGSAFLVVRRDGSSGPLALAAASEERTVSPGTAYAFGAQVKAASGAHGVVRVRWITQSDDGAPYVSATDLVSDGSWTEIRGVAVPPPRATAAVLEFGNAGAGSVSFDDVYFGSASGDRAKSVTSGDVTVSAAADGSITLTRAGDVLLRDAMVVCRAVIASADATQPRGPRIGAAVIDSVSQADGGITVTGKALDTLESKLHPFSMTWSAGEAGDVLLDATLPEGAAVVGVVPDEFIEGGNGVFRGDGTSVRLTGPRSVAGVAEAFLGERKPYQVESAGESEGYRLLLFQRDGSYEIGFAADEGALALRLRTDNRALIAERASTVNELREAIARNRYGEAIARAGEVATKFAAGHAEQVSATETLERLDREGTVALEALERRIELAREFDDANDLAGAVAQAGEIAAAYEGHAFANRANELAAVAQSALEARAKEIAQREAQPILAAASDHAGAGNVQLARAFYEEVVARFEGTEAAGAAKTALAALEGRD